MLLIRLKRRCASQILYRNKKYAVDNKLVNSYWKFDAQVSYLIDINLFASVKLVGSQIKTQVLMAYYCLIVIFYIKV